MSPHYNPGDLLLTAVEDPQDRGACDGKTVLYSDRGSHSIGVLQVVTTRSGDQVTLLKDANPWSPAQVYEDGDELTIEGRVLGVVERSEEAFANRPEDD